MALKETDVDGVLRLELTGRLDSGSCAELEATLLSRIAGGARALVLDMTALAYVSSAGLRSLIVGAKAMQEVEGKLVLAGVREEIRRVLEVCGLTEVFPSYPDAAAAVDALR